MKKNKDKKTSVLLDSHAIIHRAYHALPDFSSSKGEPTGALFGLVSMLLKIISELKPDYIIACYDLPKPTYRHEVYEGYKAQRKKIDDDLIFQLEKSKEIFKAFNIPIYSKQGFEADDILGTLSLKLKSEDVSVIIASGDMDTMQLVDDDMVRVYTLRKGINDTILYDEKSVLERFGFVPDLLPDFKGLRGDPSDNIVGVPGIGEKTATTLIQNFGTVENIYKTLKENKELLIKSGLKERIIKLLEEHEDEALFSKALATIRTDVPIDFSLPQEKWGESVDLNKVTALFNELDFRTLSNRVRDVFKTDKGSDKPDTLFKENIDSVELKETSIALWILNSNIVNPEMDDILNFSKKDSFIEAKDVIFKTLKEGHLYDVYLKIEKPLIPILEKMEKRGVKIDKKYLEELSKDYRKELSLIEEKIWKYAGVEFNISSPKQLGEVIFEKMKLKTKNQKVTSTGAKSTKESELEKLRGLHPIIDEILRYREFSKLLSTYIDNIPLMLDTENRLHAKFSQTGTTTGRMSSNNPNLQNIPNKTELGRKIRKAFISEKGFRFIALDYSQIELRIAAFLSEDKKLMEIFKSKGDVHTAVASEMFGVSEENVTKEMRNKAKVINFGILYGMGINALRTNLKTSREEAQNFYNTYFEKFSGLANYLERIKELAKTAGFIETFFGRRRYFQGINSKIPYIRASAERMAINAPIQGTEADIVKIAMRKIDDYISANGAEEKAFLLLQVHDELVYEVEESFVKEFEIEAQKIMENVLSIKDTRGVPLKVNCASGKNWSEMS